MSSKKRIPYYKIRSYEKEYEAGEEETLLFTLILYWPVDRKFVSYSSKNANDSVTVAYEIYESFDSVEIEWHIYSDVDGSDLVPKFNDSCYNVKSFYDSPLSDLNLDRINANSSNSYLISCIKKHVDEKIKTIKPKAPLFTIRRRRKHGKSSNLRGKGVTG